ncbi:hypothetical protein Vretifemale_14424 [Volvox reticuliferus]|nr:hypothetical protein Vretifemale_14424 [Volvox reticuliferus]
MGLPSAESCTRGLDAEEMSLGTRPTTMSAQPRQQGAVRRPGGSGPGMAQANRGQPHQQVQRQEKEKEEDEDPAAALAPTQLVHEVTDVSEPPAATATATATAAWEVEALRLMQEALPAGSDLELHPSHLCGLAVSELSAAQLEGLDTLHRAALTRISEARIALAVRVELERAEEDRQRQLEIWAIRDRDHPSGKAGGGGGSSAR